MFSDCAIAEGLREDKASQRPRATGSGGAGRLPWRVPIQSGRTRHGIPVRRGDDGTSTREGCASLGDL